MSMKIKVGLGAMMLAAVVIGARIGYAQLHPVLRYVLDGAFFWCMGAVFIAVGVLALMFFNKVGRTNGARATLSLSVILLTIFSNSLFGWVAEKINRLIPSGVLEVDYALSILGQVVSASSLVLSFATAGIALALLIGTFPKTQAATQH